MAPRAARRRARREQRTKASVCPQQRVRPLPAPAPAPRRAAALTPGRVGGGRRGVALDHAHPKGSNGTKLSVQLAGEAGEAAGARAPAGAPPGEEPSGLFSAIDRLTDSIGFGRW